MNTINKRMALPTWALWLMAACGFYVMYETVWHDIAPSGFSVFAAVLFAGVMLLMSFSRLIGWR